MTNAIEHAGVLRPSGASAFVLCRVPWLRMAMNDAPGAMAMALHGHDLAARRLPANHQITRSPDHQIVLPSLALRARRDSIAALRSRGANP